MEIPVPIKDKIHTAYWQLCLQLGNVMLTVTLKKLR